jgi:beta-galactosidase
MKLPVFKPVTASVDPAKLPRLVLKEDAAAIWIEGIDFSATVRKADGTIASLIYRGKELIRSGPSPDFWRAPTDNDYGNKMQVRCAVWREAGRNRKILSVKAAQTGPAAVRVDVSGTLPAGEAAFKVSYVILGSGDIFVSQSFRPGTATLPELPRFGMQMTLPASFDSLSWFGRGPQENYSDRRTGAAVGVYSGSVADQFHPYVRPQENGYKTDVRWLALTDSEGTGLLVTGLPLVCAGASRFLADDYEFGPEKDQRHPAGMKPRDFVVLNVDLGQMGVGGDNSWGAKTHDEYMFFPKEYSYSYRLKPFSGSDGTPGTLSKTRFAGYPDTASGRD